MVCDQNVECDDVMIPSLKKSMVNRWIIFCYQRWDIQLSCSEWWKLGLLNRSDTNYAHPNSNNVWLFWYTLVLLFLRREGVAIILRLMFGKKTTLKTAQGLYQHAKFVLDLWIFSHEYSFGFSTTMGAGPCFPAFGKWCRLGRQMCTEYLCGGDAIYGSLLN